MAQSLQTAWPDLHLRLLLAADAPLLHRLVKANAEHLTRNGDYGDLVAMSCQDLETELSVRDRCDLPLGIFLRDELIGRVDLVAVDPPRYSMGYWLSEHATGQGYASESLRALIEFARLDLGVSELYAGVTHGNGRSVRLLQRLGFEPGARFETYTRFLLAFGPT